MMVRRRDQEETELQERRCRRRRVEHTHRNATHRMLARGGCSSGVVEFGSHGLPEERLATYVPIWDLGFGIWGIR